MVLFKVHVEEKIPEPPEATKKPEPAVVPPKEKLTKREKGTYMFLMDLFSVTSPGFVRFSSVLSFESVYVLNKLEYVTQLTRKRILM